MTKDTMVNTDMKPFLNRRKQKRYITHGHAYLVIQPYTEHEQKLQVIDISQGGCAFIYTGELSDLAESGFANLLTGDCTHLEKVQYSTRSDTKFKPTSCRRGVEFRWLGEVEKKQLNAFIESAALCPAG